MTRRSFGLALLSSFFAQKPAMAQSRAFELRGRLTATDSERVEHIANFGKAFAWFVNDTALWDQVEPLLGAEVKIRIEPV